MDFNQFNRAINFSRAKFIKKNGIDPDIMYLGEVEAKALDELFNGGSSPSIADNNKRPRLHLAEFNGMTVVEVKTKTYINFGPNLEGKTSKWDKYNENRKNN